MLRFEEPFTRFRAHGTIVRDGAKMSKSRGNVVIPDEYVERWGADTFRTYLMFLGPYEEGGDFRDQSIAGVRRFLDRLWASVDERGVAPATPDPLVMRKLHQTIKKVVDDIPALSYNTAIAAMMEYINVVRREERTAHRAEVEPLVQLVSPFAPHVAEELWERLGHDRERVRLGLAVVRSRHRGRGSRDDRRAGEREDARHGADPDRRRPGRRASRGARRSGHREVRRPARRRKSSSFRGGCSTSSSEHLRHLQPQKNNSNSNNN